MFKTKVIVFWAISLMYGSVSISETSVVVVVASQ
jgi:hypothetical protein